MNIYAAKIYRDGPDVAYVKAENVDQAREILFRDTSNRVLWNRLHRVDGVPKYGLHFVGRVPSGYDDSPGIVS